MQCIYIYIYSQCSGGLHGPSSTPNVLVRRLLGQPQGFPNWFRTTSFRTGFELFELVHQRFRTTRAPENHTHKKQWRSKFSNWLIQVFELQLVGKQSFRTKPICFELFELVGGRVCTWLKGIHKCCRIPHSTLFTTWLTKIRFESGRHPSRLKEGVCPPSTKQMLWMVPG